MLTPPPARTVAVSTATWANLEAHGATPVSAADLDEPGSVIVEVWTYPPESLSQGPSVDPLSLYLSLRDHDDTRIERARESLTALLA